MESIFNYSSGTHVSKKLIEESNDTTLEIDSYISNDNLEILKPKKKKKHDRSSVGTILNDNTDANIPEESVKKFSENMIKKNKIKSNKDADTSFDSINYVTGEDIDTQKPKKKKKRRYENSLESISNFSTDSQVSKKLIAESNDFTLEINSHSNNDNLKITKLKKNKKNDKSSLKSIFNYSTDANIPKEFVEESSENMIKSNKDADTSFESINYVIDEDIDAQKPKKKKRRDKNSIESISSFSTDTQVSKKLIEESNDIPLKVNSYINDDNLEISKSKKKKKHDRSSVESNFNYITDANIPKESVDESSENMIKKNKIKSNEDADTSYESNINVIDEHIMDVQKLKKKKRRDKSSLESISCYSTDIQVAKKLDDEFNGTTLEINNDNLEISKPKKNKKNDRSSLKSIFNYSTNANIPKEFVEESSENMIKSNKDADTSFESINYVIDEDIDAQKPKKKKRRDKNSIESISSFSTDTQVSKKLIEESNDIPLKVNSYINDDNLEISKSKKKKKHDRSSVESNFNYITDANIPKESVDESSENMNKKNKIKSNEDADTSYESNINVIDEHIMDVRKHKKKKRRDKSSLESISCYSTDIQVAKKLDDESNGTTLEINNDNLEISKPKKRKKNNRSLVESTYNYGTDANVPIESVEESSENMIINDCNVVNPIAQENKGIKDILQAINQYELESPSTTKDKVILEERSFLNQVINSHPSIYNHVGSKYILKIFSIFMKSSLTFKVQEVTQSDIILLKFIGKNILEKIVDAYDKSKIIENYINIELPPECQNNKIHYLETSLTCKHDKEKINLIKKVNPAYKFGQFSKEEDNLIHKYWSKFKQEYNISEPGPFLSIRGRGMMKLTLSTKIKMQFIRYISAELPNRLLSSVYNRFNVLYSNLANKLSFSEEEDKIIMIVDNCDVIKNKISLLTTLLNRSKGQIFRRIHSLKMKPLRGEYIFWDINKLQKLFTSILLETNTKNWNDLKNIKIKQDTWIQISKHFDKIINYEKCQTQWNFLKTKLFCKTPIKYSTLKVNVLQLLLKINPKSWSDLNWVEISNELYPGACFKVINIMFHWWITSKVPTELRGDVKETLKYLKTNCLDSEIEKIEANREKELSRLTVEDKDVLVEVK